LKVANQVEDTAPAAGRDQRGIAMADDRGIDSVNGASNERPSSMPSTSRCDTVNAVRRRIVPIHRSSTTLQGSRPGRPE
jgi:hypothetical protein